MPAARPRRGQDWERLRSAAHLDGSNAVVPVRLLPVLLIVLCLTPTALPAAASATQLPTGVSYEVRQSGTSRAYIAGIALSAAPRAAAVLSNDRLAGFETTSSMAGRTAALVAVNGDFALASGRPVHAFAAEGSLAQTAQLAGRGVGLDRPGADADLGFPAPGVRVAGPGAAMFRVATWNSGPPEGDAIAGYSSAGVGLEEPPGDACYVQLARRSAPAVQNGVVRTQLTAQVRRCSATAPSVPPSGAVLAARRGAAGAGRLLDLAAGQTVTLSQQLGFAGTWGLVGASEALVSGGRVSADVDAPGDYVQGAQPRTAVALTGDGLLLLVVVDGRQPGYSTGMSLRELAELLVGLGAREAVNLDGGGSSTMWVQGRVVNRPSDGAERPVSSALVVLPAHPAAARSAPAGGADPELWRRVAADAGSTGGLADARARRGAALPPGLAGAAALFARTG